LYYTFVKRSSAASPPHRRSAPVPPAVQPPALPDPPAAQSPSAQLPALLPEEQRALRAGYLHGLFLLGEEALRTIQMGLICGEMKERTRVAFGVLDRIGLSGKADSVADGSASGSSIASAAVRAAIEGMAHVAGIGPADVEDILQSRQPVAEPRQSATATVQPDQPVPAAVLAAFEEVS